MEYAPPSEKKIYINDVLYAFQFSHQLVINRKIAEKNLKIQKYANLCTTKKLLVLNYF